ncbi:phosphate butyryltransferase [Bacillus sp. FJAT-42376]|uniref:phosphate butyryltransferase n=1 Tax=Bacillus sp. FJAT-42376 TaxID=2014076 RepID=UPI000F4D819A|nr:phosphate butyryltransferase [Bacillus sp. FJAT-42376]AZB43490.1 phosphate butyryltransferase [Bacillus sp. FJAT-42376]
MNLQTVLEKASGIQGKRTAIACGEDHEVIEMILKAQEYNLAEFILYGDEAKISALLDEKRANQKSLEIVHASSQKEAAEMAVKAVRRKDADVLMKGGLPTAILMKEVLNKEYGLRTGNILSHVAVFDVPSFNRLVFITDVAMNIQPDLQQKIQITENAVKTAGRLGLSLPKVAPIAAVEMVNPSMQATLDAAVLTQMNQRGQIGNCLIDGPMALDVAVSEKAAEHKGVAGEVAGKADILLMPNMEAGNIFYKSLVYFAHGKVGGLITGAKAPIVVTSRSDSSESKLYSLALAICNA